MPENSDGRRATAIRDWNRAVKASNGAIGTAQLAAKVFDKPAPTRTARKLVRPVNVPCEFKSRSPEQLRRLVSAAAGKLTAQDSKLLLDVAAEIEGAEEAFAAVVCEITALRLELARTTENLQSTLALIPVSPKKI